MADLPASKSIHSLERSARPRAFRRPKTSNGWRKHPFGNKKWVSRGVTPDGNPRQREGPSRAPRKPGKKQKMGFPERYARREPPTKECGGVLLSHTLSSAVPSPRPGLSFRVRKGTGRLTWAMTTAKPIQRPTHQGIGRQRNQPRDRFRSWRSGNRTTDAGNQRFTRHRHRDHRKTMLPAIQRENHHRTRPNPPNGLESVPRSPVSTGRLHPSRDFHPRPIEHVFNMRATDAPKSVKES